jgi:small subunit ribosomal protein S24e
MSTKFVLYTRKMIRNPLLARKQMQVEMIHPDEPNVSKEAIKEKLAGIFKSKSENIAIYGLSTKFGGGRSSGFALIYDSLDLRKQYDLKTNLRRDKQWDTKKLKTRKQLKDIKGRVKRVRGTAKARAADASSKKKK